MFEHIRQTAVMRRRVHFNSTLTVCPYQRHSAMTNLSSDDKMIKSIVTDLTSKVSIENQPFYEPFQYKVIYDIGGAFE